MQRFLRDSAATLHLQARDQDGEPLESDECAVAITDSAGTSLAGSPFDAESDADGAFTLTLPPSLTADLDVYDVVATFDNDELRREQYEVVGGFLFELPALRNYDSELEDPDDPPAALLRQARDAAMDRFERNVRPSFWRRGRRATVNGQGLNTLVLPDLYPRRVVSAAVAGVELTEDQVGDLVVQEYGIVERADSIWLRGGRNVVVYYEHGWDSVPEVIAMAGVKLAASYIIKSPLPDRATSESSGDGTFRISIAGRDGPTGIPDVDAIFAEFSGSAIPVG